MTADGQQTTPVPAPLHATVFSDTELADLRAHGIVLFADRVIFDAQPPMPADQIAAVQACCHDELPPSLLELWSTRRPATASTTT
ncbi:hypothetical protein [Burkholderia sp. NLJ2]|uniref:hypothetical protein n=1 Tax=Burkholderia sp. NLJ2 TaxID=3090699 RepID=UPI003C6CAC30